MRHSITRRGMLSAFGSLAASGAVGFGWPAAARENAALVRPPSEASWRHLKERLSGSLLRPGDKGYAGLSRPNNLRYSNTLPAAIARCSTAQDVSQAILWARQENMPLVARSGGHSYAGFSTTKGLMIDLSPMRQVEFDPSSGVSLVGGGARNAHLYAALRKVSASTTHGRCAGVGAAGFLLGGGIGFNMRTHGVGCDHLVETDMVLADGTIVTANATQNTDLFWAARGAGGGNFGIHTSFRVQGFAVKDICAFKIVWEGKVEDVVGPLMSAVAAAPETLGAKVSLLAVTARQRAAGEDVSLHLMGQLRGTPDELKDILAPAYRVRNPASEQIQVLPYWEAQDILSEEGKPAYYQERSRFVTQREAQGLFPAAMEHLRRFPGSSKLGEIKFFLTGGRVNAVEPDATAFVHRRSDWLSSVEFAWGANDGPDVVRRGLEWQARLYDIVVARAEGGAYVSFPDPSLQNAQAAYYGSNLRRLSELKAKYDADRVFHYAQGILPATKAAQAN